MIVGLTGSICSGKETMADYLVNTYNFKKVNILELFRKHIIENDLKDDKKNLTLMNSKSEVKQHFEQSPRNEAQVAVGFKRTFSQYTDQSSGPGEAERKQSDPRKATKPNDDSPAKYFASQSETDSALVMKKLKRVPSMGSMDDGNSVLS